jgi:hypothetical protein
MHITDISVNFDVIGQIFCIRQIVEKHLQYNGTMIQLGGKYCTSSSLNSVYQ